MRKQHTAAFKAKIVLETLRETKTLAQVSFAANERVAAENQIHPTLLSKWRTEALSAFPDLFERGAKTAEKSDAQEQRIEQLYQEVGRLTLQVNWLKKKSGLEPESL